MKKKNTVKVRLSPSLAAGLAEFAKDEGQAAGDWVAGRIELL